jgi:tartrate-resistant acid phosphatase type 5
VLKKLQVQYGQKESRWVFPNLWHDFVYQDPAGFSVHFVVIDTQSLRWGINTPSVQLQWLDETLAASTAEWRVVIAHHPPYSAGNYGPGDSVIQRDVSLLSTRFVRLPNIKRS